MRLTTVLNSPPIFRYWKHFGAGLKRRQPNFKHWRYQRLAFFERRKIPDNTLPEDKLPPGARVLDAEDLLLGHIDDMPDELLKRKAAIPELYDHPWPYNVQLDPLKSKELMYHYTIQSRFFQPVQDCQVLTNSLIETDCMEAHPPLEPSGEHMETVLRQIEWATKGDSVSIRLPKSYGDWPKLNLSTRASFGVTKERRETNIMNTLAAYSQTLLAKHYHEQANLAKLDDILNQRSLNYPNCMVPFEREKGAPKINMNLFIDSITLGSKSLPQIESEPDETRQREPVSIEPRSWKSLLEKSRHYSEAYTFTLPRNAQLHTIQIGSRILRTHRDETEMLARLVIHSFGLTSQFARFREIANENVPSSNEVNKRATCILENPLEVRRVNEADLERPITLQTIGYDNARGEFHFMRYQLNTLNFNDSDPQRVKNLVWHSGPISEIDQVLRYYLDFQAFDSTQVDRLLADTRAARQAKLDALQTDDTRKSAMEPGKLAEGY